MLCCVITSKCIGCQLPQSLGQTSLIIFILNSRLFNFQSNNFLTISFFKKNLLEHQHRITNSSKRMQAINKWTRKISSPVATKPNAFNPKIKTFQPDDSIAFCCCFWISQPLSKVDKLFNLKANGNQPFRVLNDLPQIHCVWCSCHPHKTQTGSFTFRVHNSSFISTDLRQGMNFVT